MSQPGPRSEAVPTRRSRPSVRPRWGRRESVFQGNVAVMTVTSALNVAGQMIWYPVLPLYLRDLGAADFQVSLAYGLFIVASALLQLPGGVLADRFGRKPLIAWPSFVAAAAVLFAGLARSWALLTLGVLVLNAAFALQNPSYIALLAESVPAERRGEAFALAELSASLGFGVGPMLGAVLVPYVSHPLLFALSGCAFLVSSVIRLRCLTETRERRGLGGAAGTLGEPTPAPSTVRSRPAAPFHPRALLRGRLPWVALAAIGIGAATCLTVNGPFLPLFAHDDLSWSKQRIDFAYAVGPLAAAALGMAMGRLASRKGGGYATAWGLVGSGASVLALLLEPSFPWALALITMAGISVQLIWVGYDTLRAEATTPEQRGVVLGALGTLAGLSGAVAVPLVGYLAAANGPGVAFYAAAAFSAVGVMAALTAGSAGRISSESHLGPEPLRPH